MIIRYVQVTIYKLILRQMNNNFVENVIPLKMKNLRKMIYFIDVSKNYIIVYLQNKYNFDNINCNVIEFLHIF